MKIYVDEQKRYLSNDSYGNRTRVTAVKGRCLNRLTKEPCSSQSDDSFR